MLKHESQKFRIESHIIAMLDVSKKKTLKTRINFTVFLFHKKKLKRKAAYKILILLVWTMKSAIAQSNILNVLYCHKSIIWK